MGWIRRWRSELLSGLGLAWVAAGAWMMWLPLGAIITGMSLLVIARALNEP